MGPVYQADHTLLLALPAFAPAVVVVGVVVYVAMRDRRMGGNGRSYTGVRENREEAAQRVLSR